MSTDNDIPEWLRETVLRCAHARDEDEPPVADVWHTMAAVLNHPRVKAAMEYAATSAEYEWAAENGSPVREIGARMDAALAAYRAAVEGASNGEAQSCEPKPERVEALEARVARFERTTIERAEATDARVSRVWDIASENTRLHVAAAEGDNALRNHVDTINERLTRVEAQLATPTPPVPVLTYDSEFTRKFDAIHRELNALNVESAKLSERVRTLEHRRSDGTVDFAGLAQEQIDATVAKLTASQTASRPLTRREPPAEQWVPVKGADIRLGDVVRHVTPGDVLAPFTVSVADNRGIGRVHPEYARMSDGWERLEAQSGRAK